MPTDEIRSFLEEAKKVADLPEEETDVINLELDENVIQFIRDLAKQWGCTENDVIVATIMAMCSKQPRELAKLIKK